MKKNKLLIQTFSFLSCVLFFSIMSCSEDDKDNCNPEKCELKANQTASCVDNSCHYTCNTGYEKTGDSCEPIQKGDPITSCLPYGEEKIILKKDEKLCIGSTIVACTIEDSANEAPQAKIIKTCSDKGENYICNPENFTCVEKSNSACAMGDGEETSHLEHGKKACLNGNVVTCNNGSLVTVTCTNDEICQEFENDFICKKFEPKDCTLGEGSEAINIADGMNVCDGNTIKTCRGGSFVTTTQCSSDTPYCNPGDGTEKHPVKCETYKCESNESYCETDKQNHAIRVTCMMGNLLTGKSEDATADCTEKGLFCTSDEWGGYCAPCLEDDISLCTNEVPENASRACVSDGYSLYCGFTCNDGYMQDDNTCVKK